MSTSAVEPEADVAADVDLEPGARRAGDTSHASNHEATPKTHADELPILQGRCPGAASFGARNYSPTSSRSPNRSKSVRSMSRAVSPDSAMRAASSASATVN
jgi:hypothetical protein